MINFKRGTILDATEDIICQQVNCVGVMGAGLAREIKIKYPRVHSEYKQLCDSITNRQTLLGVSQLVYVGNNKHILNVFGQLYYGYKGLFTNYDALRVAFSSLASSLRTPTSELYGKSLAIPYKFGCGYGGGDWNTVYDIINQAVGDYNVTIYIKE